MWQPLPFGIPCCAASPLLVPAEADTTTPGVPATGNMLTGATVPPGTTASVTSFLVPGSDVPIKAGAAPVQVVDEATGTVTGTIAVSPTGSYVFTPAAGFDGPVPAVMVNVVGSGGQSVQALLSITVSPLLLDGNEARTVMQGSGPVTVNLLSNTVVPPGTTISVGTFTLPGSSTAYNAGASSVTVRDPVTNAVTGSVVVQPGGTAVFTPAAGFTGQAPAIIYNVLSSDGQISPGTLSITVKPGVAYVERLP